MMSKRLAVLQAVKALIDAALPDADVVGLDADAATPDRIAPGGRVVVRSGDPGAPEVDLSPLTYNYQHPIPIQISAYQSSTRTNEEVVDEMMALIGASIEADRTLGGLVDWLEAEAPVTDDIYSEGTLAPGDADLLIVANYSTSNPLT